MLTDPVALALLALVALQIIGLVNPWHGYDLAVATPFVIAWRRRIWTTLEQLDHGAAARAHDPWDRVALAAVGALAALVVALVIAALLGVIH